MSIFGSGSSKYLERAATAMKRAIDDARVEKDKSVEAAGEKVADFSEFAADLFSPYMGSLDEGLEMIDVMSDPDRFGEVLDNFYANPQYKLLMDEGAKAFERKQAAMGDRYSGSQVAAAIEHSQQQGNKYLGDYMDRQMAMAARKIGIGEYGTSGYLDAKKTGLQGELDVIAGKDRSQDIIEKANVFANFQLQKGNAKTQKRSAIGGALGSIAGGVAGFMIPGGSALTAILGAQAGGGAGAGAGAATG